MSCFVDEKFFCIFNHFEREGFFTETQVLGRDESIQEDIDAWHIELNPSMPDGGGERTFSDRRRHRYDTIHRWLSVQAADEVRKIIKHG